jgi:hypothetical protein
MIPPTNPFCFVFLFFLSTRLFAGSFDRAEELLLLQAKTDGGFFCTSIRRLADSSSLLWLVVVVAELAGIVSDRLSLAISNQIRIHSLSKLQKIYRFWLWTARGLRRSDLALFLRGGNTWECGKNANCQTVKWIIALTRGGHINDRKMRQPTRTQRPMGARMDNDLRFCWRCAPIGPDRTSHHAGIIILYR